MSVGMPLPGPGRAYYGGGDPCGIFLSLSLRPPVTAESPAADSAASGPWYHVVTYPHPNERSG